MTDWQTQQFGKYFEKQYATSTEEWASCNRLVRKHKHNVTHFYMTPIECTSTLHSRAQYNMYVETFHNMMKQV